MNYETATTEEMIEHAQKLKKEKNCFVIAHNYEPIEVLKIADFIGDSLQMAKVAAETDADLIMLCGIKIMGETTKVLNPEKKVIMSHPDADCQLANMKTPNALTELKKKHPHAEVVCYVNSPATLKAESTITCTSSNAVNLVAKIPEDKPIIFVPDCNIGAWASYKTGRELIMFDSFCYVHDQITMDDVMEIRAKYPNHFLLVHPECKLEVCKKADFVCSTGQMIDFVKENDNVIIGTEYGLYQQLAWQYPEKDLVPLSPKMVCSDMQKTTLKGAVEALENENYEVTLPAEIMQKTLTSLNRMFNF